MDMDRRDFLKLVTTAACGGIVGGCQMGKMMATSEPGKMAKNLLGKTNLDVSIIACGGIMFMNQPPELAQRVVPFAIDKGVNYFDVAPTYGDAELKLGPALKPYRKDVYLACKTTARDRDGAARDIENSLKRLETDHFDVYQLHAISDVEKDVKTALGKGGAMEAILKAKEQGVIRHIGFTAHSPQAALAAMRAFDFDTMMYPISFFTHFRSGFEVEPVAEAKKRNIGIICIKSLAWRKWGKNAANRKDFPNCWYEPIADLDVARLAMSWSAQQGCNILIPPGSDKLFMMAAGLASSLGPLTQAERNRLKTLSLDGDPLFTKA